MKEKLSDNQFCLILYTHLQCEVARENYVTDVNGQRLYFGKRIGLEIIRHESLCDASFQFMCTYDTIKKLQGLGTEWTEATRKTRTFKIVNVIFTDELTYDMKPFKKNGCNALVVMQKWDGSYHKRDAYKHDLFNQGVSALFKDEVERVNLFVEHIDVLIYPNSDNLNVSNEALAKARKFIPGYLPYKVKLC